MDTKILYTQGNLYKGYPYGVEVELQFGSTELHGPFTSENEANNYAHRLVKDTPTPVSGPYASVKVVKIETPQASGTKIIVHDPDKRDGDYKYAV